MNWGKNKEDIVLIRVCIGCILPHNSKLIGQGNYNYMSPTGKITEQYYDYEIQEKDLNDFLDVNSILLIKYKLLDVETDKNKDKKKEDMNPVKPTTTRGYTKKEQ
jgi:hypothetical protein